MTDQEIELLYEETFVYHPHGLFREGKIVKPEYKPLTKEEVIKFALKVASAAREEGNEKAVQAALHILKTQGAEGGFESKFRAELTQKNI